MATKNNQKNKNQSNQPKPEPEPNVLERLPDDDESLSELVVERWAKNPDPGRIVAEVIAAFGDRVLHGLGRIVVSIERLADAVEGKAPITGQWSTEASTEQPNRG